MQGEAGAVIDDLGEAPILFQGDMVRAILEDRKTQTRRVIKGLPPDAQNVRPCGDYLKCDAPPGAGAVSLRLRCAYGGMWGRLWVRESFTLLEMPAALEGAPQIRRGPAVAGKETPWVYGAWYDGDPHPGGWPNVLKRVPSIHMPRWASRIDLEIATVWAQRLQDISEADAVAEGLEGFGFDTWAEQAYPKLYGQQGTRAITYRYEGLCGQAVSHYARLWDRINAAPKPVKDLGTGRVSHYVSYPWEDVRETRAHRGLPWHVIGNPWVWRVEFRRV